MAQIKGPEARVYVSAAGGGSGATLVDGAFDASFDRTPVQAPNTHYGTGAGVGRKIIRYDGPLKFKMFINPTDAGQNILRAGVTTPAQVVVDFPEQDKASGTKGQRFTGNVTISKSHPVDAMAVADVTIDPDGTVTEVTY